MKSRDDAGKRWGILVVLACVTLVACGSGDLAIRSQPGLPPGIEAERGPADTAPVVTWLEPGKTFAVVTWGSSSCLPEVSILKADGDSLRVGIETSGSGHDVCTADLGPRTSELELPDDAPDAPISIVVTLQDVKPVVSYTRELP